MKAIPFLKAASGIACIAFALNATAQTATTEPSSASQTIGQHVDNGTLTTKVKTALLTSKSVTSSQHIHVKSRNGIVWLSGDVPTAADKAAAGDVAQGVNGVKAIRNNLKVSP